jgi:hypothetical protein
MYCSACGRPADETIRRGAEPFCSEEPLTVHSPAVETISAAKLGIGELEMGPDFGRPMITPERGPVATALLYGVLLLCPGKFVLLWVLQRRESRGIRTVAGVPRFGDA